jgi:hypothetical protein
MTVLSAGYGLRHMEPCFVCAAGAPVQTTLGLSADSQANAFEYRCQCGAPIVAHGGNVRAELVIASLPESGR